MTKNETSSTQSSVESSQPVPASILLAELAQFTGTTQYFKNWLGLLFTEGVKHLADQAGAYWLVDAIASWQPEASKIDREFQLWELTVDSDRSAMLSFRRDSGMPAEIEQKI